MPQPLQLGVIGCGVIGRQHMDAASQRPDLIRLVAVADLRPDAANEAGRRFGVEAVYTDPRLLLDDGRVEAVVLALPTAGRADLAIEAFSRGKHVLLEKPAAMNAREMQRLIHARGGLVGACCSSRLRFLRCTQTVENILRQGRLGELRTIRSRGLFPIGPAPENEPPAWRLNSALNGGGLVMNWGSYDLDAIFGLTGWQLEPQTVLARQWTIPPAFQSHAARDSDGETHFIAMICCKDGPAISLERVELAPVRADATCEFIGTHGSLHFKLTTDVDNEVMQYSADPQQGAVSTRLWNGIEKDRLHHLGPVQDFAAAVIGNKPPKTTFEHALTIHRTIDAIYESARTCSPVMLDSVPQATLLQQQNP